MSNIATKGDIAQYGGEITYTGGLQGWVEAVLVKVGVEWKLTGINIKISQEKLEDYQRKHAQ